MKPGNTSPIVLHGSGFTVGIMFSLLSHTGPNFETNLDVLIWSRATELMCVSVGAEPHPWPAFPHKVLVPASYHTYLHSKLCPGASCLPQTTPGLSEKQARSKDQPQSVFGAQPESHSTNAGGYNKIEEISNDPISKGSGRYSTLGFARWAVGLSPRAPLSCSLGNNG